jgi:hypothetical protein
MITWTEQQSTYQPDSLTVQHASGMAAESVAR